MSAQASPAAGELVTVCIPTYNNASMVGDALRSAMQQTYSPLEIVVLDNDSSDDTETVVKAVAMGDARVRYVRHASNIGMAGNFNAGLREAHGARVLILCADDSLERDGVARLAQALDGAPGAVLAAGGRKIVDSAGRPIGIAAPRATRMFVSGDELRTECFVRGNVIGEPSAVLLRADAAQRGFDANYHQFVDLEMWAEMLGHGGAAMFPEPVSSIRRHAGQWSEANVRNGSLVQDKQAFFRKWAASLGPRLSWRQKALWDARMCSSVALTRAAGTALDARAVVEVFHPLLFRCGVALAGLSKPLLHVARRRLSGHASRV